MRSASALAGSAVHTKARATSLAHDLVLASDAAFICRARRRVQSARSRRSKRQAIAFECTAGWGPRRGQPSGHQAQQAVLRRLLARDLADEPARTQHDDARRQRQHLRQLARDQQDRTPARRELADERMDLGLRADVDAARRLVEDQDRSRAPRATARARSSAGSRRTARRRPRRATARERAAGRRTPAPRCVPRDDAAIRAATADAEWRATGCAARSPAERAPAACDPPARARCRARSPRAGVSTRTGCPAQHDRRRDSRDRARTAPARPRIGRRPRVRRCLTLRPHAARTTRPRTSPATTVRSTRSTSSPGTALRCADTYSASGRPIIICTSSCSESSAIGRVPTCWPSRSTLTVSHSRNTSGMRCDT